MKRLAALLLASVALVAPVPAHTQGSNPFAPPVPNQGPVAPPTPTPTPDPAGGTGAITLYLIGAGLLVAFAAIGVWIVRDARSAVPRDRRGRAEPVAAGGPSGPKRPSQAKQRARARGRAQRQARRRNR